MTNLLWTLDELLAATDGTLHGPRAIGVNGINFDSRLIQPGDLFLALDGPATGGTRDGHEFVATAFAAGAAVALVTQAVGEGTQIVVPDTLQALEKLAIAARDRCPAKRAAVTGSVGKTGVTRAILAGLQQAGRAHGPVGSFNNHIGVPLTLARMPRDTERAVFEIGMNHADEITPLSYLVAPHVSVITTVGAVHTENFPDGEAGVARAKAEIFDGMALGGIAVLNADNQWNDLLAEAATAHGLNVQTFGSHPHGDIWLLKTEPQENGQRIYANWNNETFTFDIQQRGQHWALNSLAVLLVLQAMDVTRDQASAALAAYAPQDGRGATHSLTLPDIGAITLIDESYNANPLSMRAALANLGTTAATRRVAVLTDMLELGENTAALHADLLEPITANKVDIVFCAGPLMQNLWNALPAAQRGAWAAAAAELAPQLTLQNGDAVMVKGSKGSKAASIAAYLLDKAK